MRRSAVRDRLRRVDSPVAILNAEGKATWRPNPDTNFFDTRAGPSGAPRPRSLSPHRERAGGPPGTRTGDVRRLVAGPLQRAAADAPGPSGALSAELDQWKAPAAIYRALRRVGRRGDEEFDDDDDDDDDRASEADSLASGTSAGSELSTASGRRSVLQRGRTWQVGERERAERRGAQPTEFVFVAVGFLSILFFTYWAQYALRHGYIEPKGLGINTNT